MGASNPHTICAAPLRRAGPSILAPGVPHGRCAQSAKSKEQRAKSKEQRAKSKEQRAKSKEQRAKSKEQRANKEQTKNTALCRLLMIAHALSDRVAIRRGVADRFA
jgi:hypothetical protein